MQHKTNRLNPIGLKRDGRVLTKNSSKAMSSIRLYMQALTTAELQSFTHLKCYKITIAENKYYLSSSRKLILKLMRELVKESTKFPHKEIGVMFEETHTYPKIYYIKACNQAFLHKVITRYKTQLVDCPTEREIMRFYFLGNKSFFADSN